MHAYRPDVDGLRAVAIVPVVLFHAGVPAFAGGYVGVDVFFVISGFLITSLLRQEIDAGTFTLARFYERRIRRLLPALFAMLLATSLAAAALLLPTDLVDFAESVLATVFFTSNVLFWQEAGYFGRAAEEVPLLHTWSLAVEEQFYIVFPLFLAFVARRCARRYLRATALVTVAAFALSLVMVARARDAAFYLAPARAWELGVGALLALGALPALHRQRARHVVAVLGAAAVAGSVFVFSSTTPFPGAAALAPCLGAAAIIWAGSGGRNAVGDLLATRPLVLTGLVSYSLYLWHWPLLALGRYYAVRPLTAAETAVLVACAVAASVVSWRYVERPFRGKSGLFGRRRMFLVALAAMGVFTTVAVGTIAAAGWPGRVDPATTRLLAGRDDRRPHDWNCSNVRPEDVRAGRLCPLGAAAAGEPTFIVWGDSHGRVLAEPIGAAAQAAGASGRLAVRTGCAPLIGARRSVRRDDDDDCRRFNEATLELIAGSPGIVDVVVVGRWGLLAEGTRYGHEPGGTAFLEDEQERATTADVNRRIFDRALTNTVSRLLALGKRVWIVGPVPEVGWDVPSVLARSARFGRPIPAPPSWQEFTRRQAHATATLQALDRLPGVVVLWPQARLCDESACAVLRDGRPAYFDSHHLTLHGAAPLAGLFAPVFVRR